MEKAIQNIAVLGYYRSAGSGLLDKGVINPNNGVKSFFDASYGCGI